MNRAMLTIVGFFSASLLVDSAVKGSALLVLAAALAMILRRDSAATRHLVWLLALFAMLVVPVLSAMLPQWRVLPEWTGVAPKTAAVRTSPPLIARPVVNASDLPRNAEPVEVERPSATARQPAVELTHSRPALARAQAAPAPAVRIWNWINAPPLVWATGFAALILRLLAARWMLRNSERRGTVIGSRASDDPIVTAFQAARSQLGIARPVTLLIHPEKSIPVVWGILRCRLLLPKAARHWSSEQLRSVLLHELAHVKRRDMIAQLLAQIACALHWFNPLAWFAAWRLSVERERACDDLVLAGGVRPSAYAGHLLDTVTALSPARWTQSCGLAMARKSSLEGRLLAVLNKSLNRRRVSVSIVAVALAIAASIAVPLAMLRAADEKPGAPARQQDAQKPERAATLQPATEAKLEWGEPVNGLRLALAWPPVLGDAAAGEVADFYVAVQNVSAAPIRLCTTAGSPDERWIDEKDKDRILFRLHSKEPSGVDATLQPREAVFVRLFPGRRGAARRGHLRGGDRLDHTSRS
jgi:beta-lactamase regulating signal transducer with metallopeptidase domain